MTLSEHYDAGYADGERTADRVLTDGGGMVDYEAVKLREIATVAVENRVLGPSHKKYAAYCLGAARGFRSIVR